MNLPINKNATLTVFPVDADGNGPAAVDGPNSWDLDSVPVPNGTTATGSHFLLNVASDGATAVLVPTSVGGPSVVNVSNTANGGLRTGSLPVTIVGFAVTLDILVS